MESTKSVSSLNMGMESFSRLSMTEESTGSSDDEHLQIQKLTAEDTRKVRQWRLAMTFLLLTFAAVISSITYVFLKSKQEESFEVAFDRFSRTVGDAAIAQQQNIRKALRALAHSSATYAIAANQSWPYVTMPLFEVQAADAIQQGKFELIAMYHSVRNQTVDDWTNYTTLHYQEMTQAAHIIQKGNLDRLVNDTSDYKPFISRKTKEGYFPDVPRDRYWPNWHFSPPPYTYGIINWNVYSVPPIETSVNAMLELKNETTFSVVMPYRSISLVMTKEEHEALHSRVTGSAPEHPHVLVQHPVHKDPTDYDSEIVAMFSCGLALDVSLLNLLPEGVEGIHTVIKNDHNQTFTYNIVGSEAIYVGEGDHHDMEYDDMEVVVDLALHTNPKWETTKGVVSYQMVSVLNFMADVMVPKGTKH